MFIFKPKWVDMDLSSADLGLFSEKWVDLKITLCLNRNKQISLCIFLILLNYNLLISFKFL